MSTKATFAHGPNFHFYSEAFDDERVYLELAGTEFEASAHRVTVAIPLEVWLTVQQVALPGLTLAGKTDAELRALAAGDVDERIARHAAATTDQQRALTSLFGGWVYGDAESPRDQQLERGLAHYRTMRDRQNAILERSRDHQISSAGASSETDRAVVKFTPRAER